MLGLVLNVFGKPLYPAREVIRKTDIDFNLAPWTAAEVEQLQECSASANFDNAYIFTVHIVQASRKGNVREVDDGIEDFIARLRELYAENDEEFKMPGVLHCGSNETHLKYFAMCINLSYARTSGNDNRLV